jgi:hypothetical protein
VRAARPIVRSGAGFFTKAFIWLLLLSLGALIGGAYLIKGPTDEPLAVTFIREARIKLRLDPPPAPPPPPPQLKDDAAFQEIVASREAAHTLVEGTAQTPPDQIAARAKELESQSERLRGNIDKLSALSTRYPGPAAGTEIATHARLQKDLAVALGAARAAEEKNAALKAAEAEKAARPVVVEVDLAPLNPWAGRPKESWVRWKKAESKAVAYEDEVLSQAGESGSVVSVTRSTAQEPIRLPDRSYASGKGRVLREESVRVGDQDVPCRVVDQGGVARWIPKEGPGADRVVVKGDSASPLSLLKEEELPVRGSPLKCVRFERDGLVSWGNRDVPGFLVRVQGEGFLWEVVDWGAGDSPRPEFPRTAKAAEVPAPAVEAFRRAHPWSGAKTGSWVRQKAEYVSPLVTSETTVDTMMQGATDQEISLQVETLGLDGRILFSQTKAPFAPAGSRLAGEETLKIGEKEYPCVILESPSDVGPVKLWVTREGPPLTLKIESSTSTRSAIALEQTNLRLGRHEVPCLHVILVGRRYDNPMHEEVWISEAVPGQEVRRETIQSTVVGEVRATTTVATFGDVPARKSALGFQKEDPAQLEEQRLLRMLDDAEEIVITGSVTFKELAQAAPNLPKDPGQLRSLLERSDEVTTQFQKARTTYLTVKERSPQMPGLEEKIAKLDKALGSLQKMQEALRARLK